MGRHSRLNRTGKSEETAGPPGAAGPRGTPAEPSGAGRKQRPAPAVPQAAPMPRTRGGHPEQREPGGGWGAFDRRQAGAVPPPARSAPAAEPAATPPRGVRVEGVRRRAPNGPAEQRPHAPRPRQEYIDAFDDEVYGRGRSVVPPRTGPDEDAPPGHGGPPGGAGGRGGKGARGRSLGGIAAAAVTTVLAIVVAGQVVGDEGEDRSAPLAGGVPRAQADEASRSEDRPTPSVSAVPGAPAPYGTRMAQRFPLDPALAASGRFQPVGGAAKAAGRGPVMRYRVDVEKGLPLDGELFAQAVHKTLSDDRGWGHGGARAFERVSSGDADFVITLASPGTTAAWCAKSGLDTTVDNVSCDSASTERIMINAYRWARGARTFGDDMHGYRQMLINHEVGHRLGFSHEGCPRKGALAPVMMQQTKFLGIGDVLCKPNAWPHPGR